MDIVVSSSFGYHPSIFPPLSKIQVLDQLSAWCNDGTLDKHRKTISKWAFTVDGGFQHSKRHFRGYYEPFRRRLSHTRFWRDQLSRYTGAGPVECIGTDSIAQRTNDTFKGIPIFQCSISAAVSYRQDGRRPCWGETG
jgi:hypothetical protein